MWLQVPAVGRGAQLRWGSGACGAGTGTALPSVLAHESCPGPAPGSPGHREAGLRWPQSGQGVPPSSHPQQDQAGRGTLGAPPVTLCAGAEGRARPWAAPTPARPVQRPHVTQLQPPTSTAAPPSPHPSSSAADLTSPPGRDGLLLAKPRLLDPSCRPSLHPPTPAPQRLHSRRPWEECGALSILQ